MSGLNKEHLLTLSRKSSPPAKSKAHLRTVSHTATFIRSQRGEQYDHIGHIVGVFDMAWWFKAISIYCAIFIGVCFHIYYPTVWQLMMLVEAAKHAFCSRPVILDRCGLGAWETVCAVGHQTWRTQLQMKIWTWTLLETLKDQMQCLDALAFYCIVCYRLHLNPKIQHHHHSFETTMLLEIQWWLEHWTLPNTATQW